MNVLMAGVGGQGILFATGLLTHLAARKGWPVMACETHGMAQRGGSVVCHLRLNQRPAGPLIPKGKADLLVGLNEDEGLRHLGYLRKGGYLLLERGKDKLRGMAVSRYLSATSIKGASVPAFSMAMEAGFPLGANLIILGAASAMGWLPFSPGEMEGALAELSRRPMLEQNLRTLRVGFEAGREAGGSWGPSPQYRLGVESRAG